MKKAIDLESRSPAAKLAGKNILITGGLGFIGSSLAIKLLDAGAKVLIIDNFLKDHGANWNNINGYRQHPNLRVNLSDAGDTNTLRHLIEGCDIVYHLAGQVSHVLSLVNPFPDIKLNIGCTAALMEVVKSMPNPPKVIYTGTRGQYGKQTQLPVREDAPMEPRGLYELTNLSAEMLVQIYAERHNISAVSLRLTNIFGPRAQVIHPHFGVLNWFVRLAVEGKDIPIMGTGLIKRDFLHIDDCVQALILAANYKSKGYDVFNIGKDTPDTFLEAAKYLSKISGAKIKMIEFSKERAAQEPGDFYSDISKARAKLGWSPTVDLNEGLEKYYFWLKEHASEYFLDPESNRLAEYGWAS